MIWYLVLAGCMHTLAPLYPDAVTPVAPPPEKVAAPVDDLPEVGFYITGKPPPFVVNGLVTGRGQVLPESLSLAYVQKSRDLGWWTGYGVQCYRDRAGYDASRQQLYTEAIEARRRSYWIGAGGVSVGIVVGFILAK